MSLAPPPPPPLPLPAKIDILFSPPPSTTPTPPESDTPSPPSPPSNSIRRAPRNPPSTPSSLPLPPSHSSDGLSKAVVVGIAIGGVIVLVALTLIYFFCKKKRRRDHYIPPLGTKAEGTYGEHQQQNALQPSDHMVTSLSPQKPITPPPPRLPPVVSSSSISSESTYSDDPGLPASTEELIIDSYQGTFSYAELERATNGFSEANWLGQGGFGYVYKGILTNGKEVAVKQLKAGSAQGEREFQAEVGIISRVHHKHLVSLVGYCVSGAQRLLVYEFVPNNNLKFHLHGKGQPPMEWSSRLKIALGSAKGLLYLHEFCNRKIIHRDIKAANILIDFNFEAKVADFGLVKIVPDTNTHDVVSAPRPSCPPVRRITATKDEEDNAMEYGLPSSDTLNTVCLSGYLAPEYAASGKLTEKSDVYSFGVVILELITGRRPLDDANNVYTDDNLVDWARPLLDQASEKGNFEVVVDTKLNNEYDRDEMARMVACAAACLRHIARCRPTMNQVVRVLEGNISPRQI